MDDSPSLENTDKEEEEDSDLDSLYDAIKEHDDIRFATYRTAAKIRFVQRKGYLHHLDIWNIIEAFRENGLNTMEAGTLVNRARLETLLSSLYSNLNKRLPPGQNIQIEKTCSLIATWLLFSLCSDQTNRLKVFSVKICLAVLCCGKLMDKLRYLFSQLTDSNGQLVPAGFTQFIGEISKLPAAVGEGRTFSLTQSTSEIIFPPDSKVTVNDFLETMMSDPGPHCVSWLIVLHRISGSESNFHPVECSGCRREGFQGLRYKSDSANYHLCQLCFWRGEMDSEHKDDVFKEYSAWKTPGKPAGLRRSIRCVPQGPANPQRIPRFPEKPEPTLDLSNIVPASPLPLHNGFNQAHNGYGGDQGRRLNTAMSGLDKLTITRLHGSSPSPQPSRRYAGPVNTGIPPSNHGPGNPGIPLSNHGPGNPGIPLSNQFPPGTQFSAGNQFATLPQARLSSADRNKSSHRGKTDEHELIACYANHLADPTSLQYLGLATGPGPGVGMRPSSSPEEDQGFVIRRNPEKDSRRLVYELEKKNAEIMNEIARLRQNRASVQDMEKDPNVVTELEVLRQRRLELETRLSDLQETRKDLMVELEELMKILRVQGNQGNQGNQRQEFQGANHQFQGGNHQFQGGNHQFHGGNNQSPRVGSYRQEIAAFPGISRQDLPRTGLSNPKQTGGGGAGLGWMQEDPGRGKSYQACKFSQVTKHQNVSSKLRPLPTGLPNPYERTDELDDYGRRDEAGRMEGRDEYKIQDEDQDEYRRHEEGRDEYRRQDERRDEYRRQEPGRDEYRRTDEGPNTISSPDSTSVPASVNSLSE